MPKSINLVAQLILKYLRNEMSGEEKARLDQWVFSDKENHIFMQNISSEKICRIDQDYDQETIFEKIQGGIRVTV
ncbi:MAG TPA: hypothetical protein VMH01_13140 [Puia sp.]|nr:hypothetical protein [Puia sp.]